MTLDNIIVVLHRPRDLRNIGAVVRAMKNTGLVRLRLVAPAPFEQADITGIAHRSEDVLARLETFGTLDAALADCTHVVGTSARAHRGQAVRADVRVLAGELRQRAVHAPIALLFGSEDNGLDNDALDRCHDLVTLPVNPDYNSLNLAQAVLLLCYEIWMVEAAPTTDPIPSDQATAGQLETLFNESERALRAIEFFKSGPTPTMSALRQIAHQAAPTPQQAALLTAIAREVQRFLERRGGGW